MHLAYYSGGLLRFRRLLSYWVMIRVPEGWFDYSRFGSTIDSTRIVAVKTPLKEQFNTGQPAKRSGDYAKILRGVPVEEEFTPRQMLKLFNERGWNVGLVIDLTFTNRYYDPKDFIQRGVSHLKIRCPGQVIPPDDVYHKFCTGISEFLSDPRNGDDLVAVHCTHGLNRTGYLVCRYLMEECGYDADKAIAAFNKGRGNSIERENFLEHLRKRCPRDVSSPGREVRQLEIGHSSHHSHRQPYHHQDRHSDVCAGERGRGEGVSGGERRRGEGVSAGDGGRQREKRRQTGEVVTESSGRDFDLRSKLDRNTASRAEERMRYHTHQTHPSRGRRQSYHSPRPSPYYEHSHYCEDETTPGYHSANYHSYYCEDEATPGYRSANYHSRYYECEATPGYHSANYHRSRGADMWRGQHTDHHWGYGTQREREREERGRW